MEIAYPPHQTENRTFYKAYLNIHMPFGLGKDFRKDPGRAKGPLAGGGGGGVGGGGRNTRLASGAGTHATSLKRYVDRQINTQQ